MGPRDSTAALMLVIGAIPALGGCVGPRLRALEYRELTAESSQITSTTAFLQTGPKLGSDYAALAFVSTKSLNTALAGFPGTKYEMKVPRGAKLIIDSVSLESPDGTLTMSANARADSKNDKLEVAVRARIDLVTSVTTDSKGTGITFQPFIRELVPTVRVSFFKFRLWWFVERLLLVKAQDYVDSLPALRVPLAPNINIDLEGKETQSDILTQNGTVTIKYQYPGLSRHYQYKLKKVLSLREGVYLLFDLADVS